MRIGLVGAGAMGSALGASWRAGGSEVRTCLEGRSDRTRALAGEAGLALVPTIDDVVDADIVVSIVPPRAAVGAIQEIAVAVRHRHSNPVIVDLNAVAPSTVERICAELGADAEAFVDGSVSGLPPQPGSGKTTVYLSGQRADEVAAVASPWTTAVVLGREVGTASALKMCTASMYKGMNALVIQAMLTASRFGVLEAFLADVSTAWPHSVPRWPWQIAVATAKSERFADEMREIAKTQSQAGLAAALFDGVAEVFERVSDSDLGQAAPESIDEAVAIADVIRRLQ